MLQALKRNLIQLISTVYAHWWRKMKNPDLPSVFDAAYYADSAILHAGFDPLGHFLLFGKAEDRAPHPLFDPKYYRTRYPEVVEAELNPLIHYLNSAPEARLSPHPLFDADYYLRRNPDAAISGLLPLVHYLKIGWKEGLSPHPLFDPQYYLDTNPDVAAMGVNPLLHFLAFGHREGRNPHPVFNLHWYRLQADGALPPGINPLIHYVREGCRKRYSTHQLFDVEFFLKKHPEAAKEGNNPLEFFLERGLECRLSPHPLFDTNYYLEGCPDAARANVNPLVHYLTVGWRLHRQPAVYSRRDAVSPVFRRQSITVSRRGPRLAVPRGLRTSKKLRRAAQTLESASKSSFALHSFLAKISSIVGGASQQHSIEKESKLSQGVSPHPLFDAAYYCDNNPDIRSAQVNPLAHFLECGCMEQRNPHRWFDIAYYLRENPDVAGAGINPLLHYIASGVIEGRRPHKLFDADFYARRYALPVGANPLVDFVLRGERLGRHVNVFEEPEELLPVPASQRPAPFSLPEPVDVIIPVYRGFEETKSCIASVLASRYRNRVCVVVVNDRSPEPLLTAWLRELAADGKVELLENWTNLGFAGSVNRGMLLHPVRDVLLLNSDTEVANDWLDRMVNQAYSNPRIGTVTAMSNNAVIASYPTFCRKNELPEGVSTVDVDRDLAEINAGRSVDIPTAVGFCMYIRRDCLDAVGLFDEASFGMGYGEENDFCMRAMDAGWRHLLAADVYVYHRGGVSFLEEVVKLQQGAMRTLTRLHPDYLRLVSYHVRCDPAMPYRLAAALARVRRSGKPVLLFVTHAFGGGIEQHIKDLTSTLAGHAHALELHPLFGRCIRLRGLPPADEFSIDLDVEYQYDALLGLLRAAGVRRVHVHHVMGHVLDLEKLIHDLGVPFDFTVHDYFSVCPYVTMKLASGKYCGEPDEAECDACILTRPQQPYLDVLSWRSRYGWPVREADRVITPSLDVADRLSRYIPRKYVAAEHPDPPALAHVPPAPVRARRNRGVLHIAILGVLTTHKGYPWVSAVARMAADRSLPLRFTVIGYVEAAIRANPDNRFQETGPYEQEDLPALFAQVNPDVVWFPAAIPETFSYTLSECLRFGAPAVVSDIGALPERVSARPWTWIIPYYWRPKQYLDFFLDIRARNFATQTPPPLTPSAPRALRDFYPEEYLRTNVPDRSTPARIRTNGDEPVRVCGLLSRESFGQLQACAYIRGVLPLRHHSMRDLMTLEVVSPYACFSESPGTVLVQRAAVAEMELAGELVHSCRRRGIRLLYETDDDLFNIPPSHSESAYYRKAIAAARHVAEHADALIVSSEPLARKLAAVNRNATLIPNALDENLWQLYDDYHNWQDPADGVTRILYMGTATHDADLELLERPVRELLAQYGPSLSFEVLGGFASGVERDWCTRVPVPNGIGLSYPAFVRWLRSLNRWQIAVAPLADSDFNRSKSYIKYLDYGALGLASVFSRVPVFEGVIADGETGLIVENRPESWHAALRKLVDNKNLRRQMSERMRQDVIKRHTLKAQAKDRREQWRALLGIPSRQLMVSLLSGVAK